MKKITLIAILLSLLSFSPVVALAQNQQINALQEGLKVSAGRADIRTEGDSANVNAVLGRIINSAFALLGAVFLLITVVGGLLWMMAGGNEEKVKRAKGFLGNGINGIIVIFFSYGLVYIILRGLDLGTSSAQ